MEGALSKWTNVVKGWQYRWFVLDDNAGLFSYYTSKEKMMRGVRRGCVRLRGAIIGIDDEDDSTFTITVDGKTFHFQAQDSQERERWIRALEDTVLRHNQTRRGATRAKGIAANGCIRVEDFDRKLSETDSYLQMLITQIAGLRAKMENPDISQESKDRYATIIDKAVHMSESIKHAIVLLQIAKNAALPSDASNVTVRSGSKSDIILIQSGETDSVVQSLSPVNRPSLMGTEHENIVLGIELGSECKESKSSSETVLKKIPSPGASRCRKSPPMATLKLKSSAIPEISYSSSEEDDFFDAEDENDPDGEDVERDDSKSMPELGPPIVVRGKSMEKTDLTSVDGAVDYDALYESDNDEEDVDMKSHGSVITHLLSQVRIGMDLTKIVLPTFILERRSLLEMYSDFFAHPDIFVAISDGKDPEERMIRVLRWYLSSFHAGRKSTIAKKPYNPILGETFRCRWDSEVESKPGVEYPKPPHPWTESENVSENELTFVAEQVSHHPPISAFYAEHVKKRISVNAYIYTKSSFLGMSVAVHNLGHGTVTLVDLDEEYIVTFPSGFGRSILTVPWVELGGKVSIQCPKTGYVSNIEFKCKQFFSSDVNKVTAEVFAPGSKKSILKVDGEWNGKLMAKYATGCHEVFMDVSKIPIHSKKCRKVLQQEPFESRRLWREVTYGLKVGDIEAATTAKSALEQRQREEAHQRKETNSTWDTKLFHPIGDNWFFNHPLSQRVPPLP